MGNADDTYSPPNKPGGDCRGHRVAIPPPQPFVKYLKNTMKETFFPDDPLRQFKNQPPGKKFILGMQYIFPILEWGPRYTLQFFKADLIAGITIASLAIPQGISYAKLANLPPILGLCECSRRATPIHHFCDELRFYFNFFSSVWIFRWKCDCRFELRPAVGLCDNGELERFSRRNRGCRIVADGINAGESGECQRWSQSLSSSSFHCHIFCRAIWSFLGHF